MNRIEGILVVVVLFALPLMVRAQTPVIETRTSLEKWIEARQLVSKTQSDWQAEKETVVQTTDMFRRELATIADQMTRVSTNNTQMDLEQQKAQQEKQELNAALEKVKTLLVKLEKEMLELSPSFPPPLAEKVRPLLTRIPTDSDNTKAGSLERLQNLVGLLNEVDKFNNAVTVVSEIQKNPAGAEVQVETMYLGLGQAYFVDKAGDYAGVGTPSSRGWNWQPESEIAEKVHQSIAMYKNTLPPAFVSLPVKLK